MEVAKDIRKNGFEALPTDIVIDSTVTNNLDIPTSVEEPVDPASDQDPSAYTLACDQSLLSGDVDRWMRGSITTETRAVQGSRPTVVQRSIEAANNQTALPSTDIAWYTIALTMMPRLLNNPHIPQWRCSHSIVANAMELACTHLSAACSRLRSHVRRLAQHQLTRVLLAAALDAVLVIYAIGFLLLSVYQGAILT